MRISISLFALAILAALSAFTPSEHPRASVNPMDISITFRASSRGASAQEFPFQLGVARFFKNGVLFYEETGGGGGGRGFNIAAIDPLTGNVLPPIRNFDTWGTRSNGTAMNAMVAYLNSLPNGTLILIAVADEAGLNEDNSCTPLQVPWTVSGYQALEALGSLQIRSYCFRDSFAMAAIKGGGLRGEQRAAGVEASVQTVLTIPTPCPAVSNISPEGGAVGQVVTINGSNLSGVNAVIFSNNVAAANFAKSGDTQITVAVPPGAVTGPITLRKPECPDVQTAPFTVTVTCPIVTAITQPSACAGGAVTINGSGFSGVSAVRFPNNTNASFVVVGDMQINATVPAGAVAGPLTIVKPGCNDVQTASFTPLPVNTSGPGPSLVTVSGRQLIVSKRNTDGTLAPAAPYTMMGVNWSPASRATNTTPFDPNNANVRRPEFAIWAATDAPLLKSMNANTVRLYIDPGLESAGRAVLDQLYSRGIMVIMTVDDASNNEARLEQVVCFYKNHPAILMWMLGSEWNLNHYFDRNRFPTVIEAARATERAARRVKALDPAHPVATSYGEIAIDGDGLRFDDTINYVRNIVPSVDVWSLNIYRGNTFTTLFSQWAFITGKPMFIGEFGTDAFRTTTAGNPPQGVVDESMQADWNVSLWNDIALNLSAKDASKVALGGLAFEFNDEWWKVSPPGSQQTGGFPLANGHPEGFANEEYFGLVDIDRVPRRAYFALAAAFAPPGNTPPEITRASLNGKKLRIEGLRFGNNPRLVINGADRSAFITSASDAMILLKGKMKKLGLRSGENTIQVVSANGESSLFVLRL